MDVATIPKGQTLNFYSEHYRKIEEGKRITIRRGIKMLHLGTCVLTENKVVRSSVSIRSLELVRYSDLTVKHAIDDGFESLDDLLRELRKLYGCEFEDGDTFTVVKFI